LNLRRVVIGVLLLLAGCGSKTTLLVPEGMDAGSVDAGAPPAIDGAFDGGRPAEVRIELPFNDQPCELRTDFVAQILSADIYFLIDVTGSMEDEINQIRSTLTTEIIPGLAAEIPDVRFSVGRYADFDVPGLGYGSMGDQVFRLEQAATDDVDRVLAAVRAIRLQSGGDTPESMVQALYLSATGNGHGRFVDPSRCPLGTVGYPCFPEGGSPIFLVFTDAPSHNGPGGRSYMTGAIRPAPHSYPNAVDALDAIGAKVLGLNSGDFGETGRADLEALARDTGAVRPDGTPLVFDIGRTGELLSSSVVTAVRTLVTEVPIDVDVLLEDIDGDGVDGTAFVTEVVAERATPADGATLAGDRFDDVRPGTRVEFRLVLQNLTTRQTDEDQRFRLRVVLRGDGVSRLRETLVEVVVPRLGGGRVCSR
jgi:hypothetical protein